MQNTEGNAPHATDNSQSESRQHFIRQQISDDLAQGLHASIVTRFPPEPNGYLHIGHAKSICLNFMMAAQFGGVCHLRFDDTNPCKEEQAYVDAIVQDVQWLGFQWDKLTYASDNFEQFYDFAMSLIDKGLAYVDNLTAEQMREYRGTLQEPGKNSPHRDRSPAESRDLFTRMRAGEFQEGEYVLRAKIDMASPNLNMRDPVIYRIRHAHHQRTQDDWCVYPMYDFAHPLTDALELVTHSLCTLEFQDHRPLYDWLVEHCDVPAIPKQYEFARLNVSHTIASKRKLRQLVEENHVNGWDDPRMPTLRGMRRRGYPSAAIREFCAQTGISKSDSVIDMTVLEQCVREQLNNSAARAMAVLDPLKVIITNVAEDHHETLSAPNHPFAEGFGERELPFSRELYIERGDFLEDAPKKFFRLSVGKEVRLRNAYIIKCDEALKDGDGNVHTLLCSIDKDTLGKNPSDRKVKGVIHWLSATHAQQACVRLYDRLFQVPAPAAEDDFTAVLNPDSFTEVTCLIEPSLEVAAVGSAFQFERIGYFVVDQDSAHGNVVFNRIVGLRDTWAKLND